MCEVGWRRDGQKCLIVVGEVDAFFGMCSDFFGVIFGLGLGGKYFLTREIYVTKFVNMRNQRKIDLFIYFEYLLIEWYKCVSCEQARKT